MSDWSSDVCSSDLAAALAGSNYIHHSAGFLESLLTVAYEQYVIDNDVNGSIMRMLKGIEVTEESLSLDVIDDVCKGPGHFLGQDRTSVVTGKRVDLRLDLGGRRCIKKKKKK